MRILTECSKEASRQTTFVGWRLPLVKKIVADGCSKSTFEGYYSRMLTCVVCGPPETTLTATQPVIECRHVVVEFEMDPERHVFDDTS
jgi:hypothetical protein